MDIANQKSQGHSAEVHIILLLDDLSLPVAQLGPNFLVLKDRINHPPADAEIAMTIDGHEERWQVHLNDGVKATERKTRITRPDRNGAAAG
jgi:hypothetical protein